MNPAPENSQKWALLIGINSYPNFASRGQLTGCIHDVEVMRQVLIDSFNFPESQIALLIDGQATREGILGAMKDLVQKAGPEDVVVVHYSGHGSQMTDLEGDEPDGLDETIVPSDSGRAPHENRDIKDDEIYLWLKDLTAKTSNVTLIFDCCHSGTIVRDDFGGAERWIEPDLRPPDQLPPSPIPEIFRGALDGGRDVGPGGWLPLGEKYVLLSGCRRDEKACEMEEPGGNRHGALTFFLAQELRKAESGTTYRDLFEALAPRISSQFPAQHPQLEGARDMAVFGVDRIEPMRFVQVVQRTADRVILGGGAACGLTGGSQWAIHPAGTKTVIPEMEPLGRVAITAVRAVTSEARLLGEIQPGAVVAGLRAVEESHALETRLPVEVVAPSGPDVQALLDGLDRSKLLRRAEPGHAKVRVYLLARRAVVPRNAPVPMLGVLREETWAVVGEDGQLLMPSHGRSEPGTVQLLLENLEKVARYRLAAGLRNEASALTGKIKVELFRKTGSELETLEPDPGSLPVLNEGEALALRITSQHEKPLFVYVLDLGLTGRISLVYPAPGAENSLLAGRSVEIGTLPGDDMDLYIPDEFPFTAAGPGEEVEGSETLKILVTTHPAEFQSLFQGGVREGRTVGSSLTDLLETTFGGGGYQDREWGTRDQIDGPEDWTALERSFRVRRRAASSSRVVAGGRGM
ncbi:MAG: caspase family protein [Thermoanaerobaculia bacterium]